MNKYRTHLLKDINETLAGQDVVVSGWVENIRDHGGVLFLDLRDETSTLQTVSNDDDMFKGIAKESVVKLTGKIRRREEGTENDRISTGNVEMVVDSLEMLGSCVHELPFEIMTSKQTKDDVRLKYRYLDMRNEAVKKNMVLRSDILHFLRNKMYDLGFTEVQTPILTASSPEGARDFVVPSRLFKGKFYALPQAPQIYKELLMVGGMGKYFQIAPCFRDEDARADRTLEFYQLDMEMSFVEEDEVLEVGESIFYDTFTKFSNKEVSKPPFRRIAYRDAMEMYGSDKPDLRNPLIIKDASVVLKDTTFGPFKKSTIKVIVCDGIGENSNSWFNEIVDYASSIGMPGIGYITLMSDGSLKGPIDKFLSDEERKNLIHEFDMKENSVMFFIANRNKLHAQKFAGLIRNELGRKMNLIDNNKLELCIINDFPMFEFDEQTKKWEFCHNPFSLPHGGIKDYEEKDPGEILAYQFDFVCNGNEMASGAIRNHDLDSLAKGFEIVGYSREEVENRFKSIFTAFKYGCPPHGGMAPGIDRLIMLIQDEPNLREVQAFPTSASGADLMMGSPATLMPIQLKELGIKVVEEDKNE
ncbi:aspartate--tRNA ligase 1 [Firmicutes bacterium CAG:582]|nr:aspartate--tRNA ligase 1 [Firmicutes bacterium CAG:582]